MTAGIGSVPYTRTQGAAQCMLVKRWSRFIMFTHMCGMFAPGVRGQLHSWPGGYVCFCCAWCPHQIGEEKLVMVPAGTCAEQGLQIVSVVPGFPLCAVTRQTSTDGQMAALGQHVCIVKSWLYRALFRGLRTMTWEHLWRKGAQAEQEWLGMPRIRLNTGVTGAQGLAPGDLSDGDLIMPWLHLLCPVLQPVRENTNRARERGDAGSQGEKVCPEAGAEEDGPRKSMDIALEELQLPPNTEGPLQQVLPQRSEAAEAPGWPASPAGLKRALPMQASDHSYALLDLDALKKKLFFTLKENEKLRKRLKAQRLVMQRMSSRLRTHRGGQQGPQARPRPEQRS
nr:THAP domain-containing protein 3 isoform X2 [Marmota flaviventris]